MSYQDDLEAALAAAQPGEYAAAIQGVLDALPPRSPGIQRPVLTLPYRDEYELEAGIVLKHPCVLDLGGSALVPPDGADGVEIQGYRAVLRNGGIAYRTWDPHAGRGVVVHAHGARVEDLEIQRAGVGVFVSSESGQYNANVVSLRGLAIFRAHEAAVHVKGGDANAGAFELIDVVGAGVTKVGLLDEAFLGNTTSTFHVSSTTEEAYRCTVPSNYSTHTGFYAESDCASAIGGVERCIASQPRVTWVGGNVIPYVGQGDRVGVGFCRLTFRDRLRTDDGDVVAKVPDVSTVRPSALKAFVMRVRSGDRPTGKTIRLGWKFAPPEDLAGLWYAETAAQDNGLTAPLTWRQEASPASVQVGRTQQKPGGSEVP